MADEQPATPNPVDFLAHHEGDAVAVAVRDVPVSAAGVAYLDSGRRTSVVTTEPIPLGHKVALTDLTDEAEVVEYGVVVALARRAITTGELVHTHNVRSARWQRSA